jgi:inner membrane protein
VSTITHLLASWIVAAKTTDNPRDCRLVTLAGILPDADGLGLLIDLPNRFFFHKEAFFYPQYHHWLLHGVLGGVFTAVLLTCFARQHLRVALLAFAVFHLHLLCDLVGSRGPAPNDLWPIFYFGPFSTRPMWMWHGQWRLDGWQNRFITIALFLWALWLAARRDDSVVGVFNRRADAAFVGVLRKWRYAWIEVKQPPIRP